MEKRSYKPTYGLKKTTTAFVQIFFLNYFNICCVKYNQILFRLCGLYFQELDCLNVVDRTRSSNFVI